LTYGQGFAGELDYDAEIKNLDRRPGAAGRVHDRNMAPGKGGSKQVNKKRLAKNSKFGFGGSKRLAKQNDAYSAASMDGYRAPGKPSSFGAKGGKAKVSLFVYRSKQWSVDVC
jgi:rRNA-processing protein EBP2